MNIETIKSVYFVGAGGIGMSALIRYFLSKGKFVAGYDRTPSELTGHLIAEGAQIHYEENTGLIPENCKDKESTLVVYTPAIPQEHAELAYFRENGFEIHKRSQVLGTITRSSKGLCVAGTHGKTTTSTMAAHLFHQSHVGCTAFLGGISKNYGTNLLLSPTSPYTVIEADEFDRSFHWLSPYMSVITSTDPDHLDIYGTREAYLESFCHYTTLIQPGGALIIRKGLALQPDVQPGVRTYTYSRDEGDFHAENIRIGNGEIVIDFIAPDTRINDIRLGVPIGINIENGVAAMALAHLNGVTDEEIRQGMASFRGVDPPFRLQDKDGQPRIPQRLRPSSRRNRAKREVYPRTLPGQEDNGYLPTPSLYPYQRLLQRLCRQPLATGRSNSDRDIPCPRTTHSRCQQPTHIRQPAPGHRKVYMQEGRHSRPALEETG